jgi:uracil-DNA glycosylase family 4
MNPAARNPNMGPEGPDDADVLVLLSHPSKDDDEAGEHLQGDIGEKYRSTLRQACRGSFRSTYVCRTRPKDDRPPDPVEVAAFRKQTERLIEESQPRLIVAAGHVAMEWLSPGIGYRDTVHRGRTFPIAIGKHRCWALAIVCPVVAEKLFEKGDNKDDKIPGDAFREQTWRDIRMIPEVLKRPFGPPAPTRTSLMEPARAVSTLRLDLLEEFAELAEPRVYLDLETHKKRPFAKGARILSIAVGDGQEVLSMPVDHPMRPLADKDRERLKAILRDILRNRIVVAHNLTFDLEWIVHFLGNDCVLLPKAWECTQMAAYCLDTRSGKSLDYLCRQYLGTGSKDFSPEELWKSITPTAVTDLVRYGAIDVEALRLLCWHLRRELKRRGGLRNYRFRMERIPALVLAQLRGMPIDGDGVRRLTKSYTAVLETTAAKARKTDAGKRFRKLTGRPFDPASVPDSITMLATVLKNRQVTKSSSDKHVLQAIVNQGTESSLIAEMCLRSRDYQQRIGTYLAKLNPGHPETYVWADGRVHPEIQSTFTGTTRTSARYPNSQNDPKRDPSKKELRGVKRARDGWSFVSSDLGQIEARGLAMTAKDPNFVDALWTGFDIHQQWTDRILKEDPGLMERRGCETPKQLRGFVKGEFVFAQFYGAGAKKVAKTLGISLELVEYLKPFFWAMFPQIKKWQKANTNFYKAKGYVESLLGSRRYGPLSYNMIINTPIQSLGSDFCIRSLVNLMRQAIELDAPFLQAENVIHDDLTFEIPNSELEFAYPIIAKAMVHHPGLDFINVPLTTETEVGPDLAHMSVVGEYSSQDFV